MKQNKFDMAMMHCYRQLYANATPAANFDELIENADTNQFGQKVIAFMDYELEEDLFEEIMEQTIKDFKITKGFSDLFKRSILLGCSPKFKRNEDTSEENSVARESN